MYVTTASLGYQGFIQDFCQGEARVMIANLRTIVVFWYFYERVCESMHPRNLLDIYIHYMYSYNSVCKVICTCT